MLKDTIPYTDLSADERKLVDMAIEAASLAYCPYSQFPVGAAILATNDGGDRQMFSGCNVENASYGLTICAERTATTKAVSSGYRTFLMVAVACVKHPGPAGSPCGACRQVLREFGKGATVLVLVDLKKSIHRWTVEELFPASFGPDSL